MVNGLLGTFHRVAEVSGVDRWESFKGLKASLGKDHQRFFTAISDLPGNIAAILTQLGPCFAWAWRNFASSSGVQPPRDNRLGSR